MLRIVILHHSPIIDMDVNRILTEIILITHYIILFFLVVILSLFLFFYSFLVLVDSRKRSNGRELHRLI
ncbi:hypothetical protein CICLE_v10024357mg [Citrus x clementina]|uniref:Uncharacterized protein n=1 Tax=Citrus clementina TaxID=85681 RepID=V4TRP4_CITCL|nr:hypothetical protein CICLE_v10024357mg [Citrus x clementina]